MKTKEPQRKRLGEWKICPQCNLRFYLVPMRVKRGETFCSHQCRYAFAKTQKVCPVCGKTFTVNKSQAHKYTVCSRQCRTTDTKYFNCERCGKQSFVHHTRNGHFCSEECRRPPILINCQTCGKQFRARPSYLEKGRCFCNFSCYRRFNGETQPETQVREILDSLKVNYIQEAKMGRYSIDFLIPNLRVALEIDGVYWHQDKARDQRKTNFLESRDWKVVRVTDFELLNSSDKMNLIAKYLQILTPTGTDMKNAEESEVETN